MKKIWKVTLWAIALLSTLLVLWGCGEDEHTCVGETWVTEKEATCQAEGSKKFVCSCGKTVKTEAIPLGNHNLVDCVCTVCGYSVTEIRTVTDLQNVASDLNANYILMNDLDLGGMEWTPIGTDDNNPFTGTFDGNGHVISNFKITGDVEYAGLFGYNEGTIQNIGLENFTIDVSYSGTIYTGGLVGRNYKGTITNCYATGEVSASGNYADAIAGGLVGRNYSGTITNSYATGDVSASASASSTSTSSSAFAYAGGLVGVNSGSTSASAITNSYATGDVSASGTRYAYAGGLVGYNPGSNAIITNCYATGDVSATASSTSTSYDAYAYAGGLVGYNLDGFITNCYATGDISASASNTSTDYDAYANAGGLIGWNSGPITNSYATGDVSATASGNYAYAYAGGLVGDNYFYGTITNSYATGDVSASSNYSAYAGGLVGENLNSGTITNCYRYSGQSFTVTVNGATTYEATNAEGTAKDMQTLQSVDFQQNTLGWSVDDWNFAEGTHPTLKNVGLTN